MVPLFVAVGRDVISYVVDGEDSFSSLMLLVPLEFHTTRLRLFRMSFFEALPTSVLNEITKLHKSGDATNEAVLTLLLVLETFEFRLLWFWTWFPTECV
jgi:hypothetical protein